MTGLETKMLKVASKGMAGLNLLSQAVINPSCNKVARAPDLHTRSSEVQSHASLAKGSDVELGMKIHSQTKPWKATVNQRG